MHTFTANNNKIIWTIKMKGDINRWPDIDESFDITVTALMTELHIELADGRRGFKPGEPVAGRVSWSVNGASPPSCGCSGTRAARGPRTSGSSTRSPSPIR